MMRTVTLSILTLLLAAQLPATATAADFDLSRLDDGGYVLLLRHVKAGGVDSDDFDLKDCRTQREVGAAGRAQAEVLAARFREAGIRQARVLTSQWCRAKQTAELLGLGVPVEEPALNYYHWRLGSEEAMKDGLRSFLTGLQAPPAGEVLVLVSHTTAFGIIKVEAPASGGGLVLKPNGTMKPEVVGAVTAPE